jgi:hypothetical protein
VFSRASPFIPKIGTGHEWIAAPWADCIKGLLRSGKFVDQYVAENRQFPCVIGGNLPKLT